MSALSANRIAAALGMPEPTPEQVAVIEHPPGRLLIVAGAGSGKTETMAARVVWLIANGHVEADQVLGLTFTRKAAAELGQRVSVRLTRLAATGLVAPTADLLAVTEAPTVSTYHAYAGRLVREHGLRLGIEPDTRLLSEAAAWQLAHECVTTYDGPLEALGWAEATMTKAIVTLSGEMAEHLIEPDDLDAWHRRFLDHLSTLEGRDGASKATRDLRRVQSGRAALIPVLREFSRLKAARSAQDFADQMSWAARLVHRFPEIGALERARFAAVVLDEFQDTSHAQLQLLQELFGGRNGTSVTAVGDPFQAIYAWRGASADTLASFPEAFAAESQLAPVLPLSTTWRNDRHLLEAANAVAEPLRRSPEGARVLVRPLAAAPSAHLGRIDAARVETVEGEADVVARWIAAARAGGAASAAILCRKRSQFPPIVAALTAHGIPFEVVGLGGLLQTPEVADLVAMLTVAHDASRGDRLMRLLTGPVARLGAADIDAFAQWARQTQRIGGRRKGADLADVSAEQASLVEALVAFSEATAEQRAEADLSDRAQRRLLDLAGMVAAVRRCVGHGVADLVGDVERILGLDVEVLARPGFSPASARAHLDAFTDVAARFSDTSDRPSLGGFLAWLEAAMAEERGLDRGTIEVAPGAVHVLTVHAAKGLEWDAVAVPGLVEGTFPAHDSAIARWQEPAASWVINEPKDNAWTRKLDELPYDLRGDRSVLAQYGWASAQSCAELEKRRLQFAQDAGAAGVAEERRLAYVALTRARHRLLLTSYLWGTQSTPRVLSRFLRELTELPSDVVHVREWAPDIEEQAVSNPRLRAPQEAEWPVSEHAATPATVQAAEAVRAAARHLGGSDLAGPPAAEPLTPHVAALLAERRAGAERHRATVAVARHLATSDLVALAADADAFFTDLRRPMPTRPNPAARRGTAFHAWIERRFRRAALLEPEDLPGNADQQVPDAFDLGEMIALFEASPWAQREPIAVELALETVLDGFAVRGRIDAVFAEPDGGVTIVDWKSGRPDTGARAGTRALQLACYRTAYARLVGLDESQVAAAFYFAATGTTVFPPLPSTAELGALLDLIPE